MWPIRLLFLLIISIPVLSVFADTLYMNFAYCVGYDKYSVGGSAGAWTYPYYSVNDGRYVTVPVALANSRGWKHNNVGDYTVISGVIDNTAPHPRPSVALVVYVGKNFSTSNTLPIPPDWPYSGGTDPQTATSANGNVPYVGSGDGVPFFGSVPPSSAPLESDGTFNYFGRTSDGGYEKYTVFQTDGQYYFQVGDGVASPVDDVTRLPIYTSDSSGSVYQGYWDAPSGLVSTSSSSGGSSVDLTPVVNAIETQGGLSRDQLVQLLGSAGQSWVYDCKLSLSQLYSLASSQGLITRPQIDLTGIQSSLDTIAGHVPPDISGLNKETTQAGIKSRLDTWSPYIVAQAQNVSTMRSTQSSMNTRLSNIETVLSSWNSDNSPSFSSPDFGDDSPDDDIPFDLSGFNSSLSQSLGQLVSWGDSGAPVLFPDVFSGLLSRMIGSIPSVGSDSVMFSFDVELPYLGHIQKTWSFSDWPFIGTFRTFILWVLYVFFGLAMFKLLHSTLI